MTALVREVPFADLPDSLREGLKPSRMVRVTVETLEEETEAQRQARIRRLIDGIKPSKPIDGLPDSVSTLRRLRDDRASRTQR